MSAPEPLSCSLSRPAMIWLQSFIDAVRCRDFVRGRDLFHNDVVGFGTIAVWASGIDDLASRQWQAVWERTCDFTVLQDQLHQISSRDRSLVIITGLWHSRARDCDGLLPGDGRLRSGRCTIVLTDAPEGQSGMKAIHTHFSKDPDGTL